MRDGFKPAAARIAAAARKEPGFIKVVGHTDSIADQERPLPVELRSCRSSARKAVADLLKRAISQPDRIQVDGKGADTPIAPNATPEGRSKNRRVEILDPADE